MSRAPVVQTKVSVYFLQNKAIHEARRQLEDKGVLDPWYGLNQVRKIVERSTSGSARSPASPSSKVNVCHHCQRDQRRWLQYFQNFAISVSVMLRFVSVGQWVLAR
jgi:hypothetical protein